jgi:hypothetical protein
MVLVFLFEIANLKGQMVEIFAPDTVHSIFSPFIFKMKVDSSYLGLSYATDQVGKELLVKLSFSPDMSIPFYSLPILSIEKVLESQINGVVTVFVYLPIQNGIMGTMFSLESMFQTNYPIDSLFYHTQNGNQNYNMSIYADSLLQIVNIQSTIYLKVNDSPIHKIIIRPTKQNLQNASKFLYYKGFELIPDYESMSNFVRRDSSLTNQLEIQFQGSIYTEGALLLDKYLTGFSYVNKQNKNTAKQIALELIHNHPNSSDPGVQDYALFLGLRLLERVESMPD